MDDTAPSKGILHLLATAAKLAAMAAIGGGFLWFLAETAPLFRWYGLLSTFLAMVLVGVLAAAYLFGRWSLAFCASSLFAGIPAFAILVGSGGTEWQESYETWMWLAFALVAAVLAMSWWRSRKPTMLLPLAVMALGFVAFLCSSANQEEVVALKSDVEAMARAEEDRRAKIDAAEEEKEKRLEETGGAMFIEETEGDAVDLEGMSQADYEAYMEKMEAAREAEGGYYDYRKRGKVDRSDKRGGDGDDDGEEGESEDGPDYQTLAAETEKDMERKLANYRQLSSRQQRYAIEYAGINNVLAKYLVTVAMLMSVVLYLHGLNRTEPACHPFPLGGRWLDRLVDKDHCVWIDSADPGTLQRFLDDCIQKGENFVCISDEPPLPSGSFPRVRLFGTGLPWPTIEHLTDQDPDFFPDSGFVFESAWFGRYAFTITGAEAGRRFLEDFIEHMLARRNTRANVAHTLNLVWACSDPVPEEAFRTIANCTRVENVRLVLFSDREPSPEVDARIEAIVDDRDF